MKRLRRHATYANVVATIALCMSLTGAAYAAVKVSGANIKAGSLLSADFKDATLAAADLSTAARNSLVGPRGATGYPGFTGSAGVQGVRGPDGVLGDPAKLTSSWAKNDTGMVTSSGLPTGNDPPLNWDDPNYGTGPGGSGIPNLRQNPAYTPRNVDENYGSFVSLTGMGAVSAPAVNFSNGPVSMPWAGNLSATVTLTFLHRADGEDWQTNGGSVGGTTFHDRILCKLAYGPVGANPTTYTTMGLPIYGSSHVKHELLQVSIVADANTVAGGVTGTNNVAALCRDPDTTATANSVHWSFVSGNLTTVGSGGA